ncbi:MAG: hypothetical protein V3V10_11250 [Planctomycetota bacterium]
MRHFNIVFAIVLIALAWACAWLLIDEPHENQLPTRAKQVKNQPASNPPQVERPTKPADTPPEHPITTGELAAEFFKNPKTVTIQMLNRETGQPTTAHTKLWPLDLTRKQVVESYNDDEQALPIRTAIPDRLGQVEIALEAGAGRVFYEFPVPMGFQPEQDPFKLYSELKDGDTTKLYYKPQPTLRVRVVDQKGLPVQGSSVYALVKAVPESLHAWADLQSLYRRGDWEEPANGICTVSKDGYKSITDYYEDWRDNPFQAALPASRFLADYYESALTSFHFAKTNTDGWCELPNMHSGNWLVVGFNKGSKDAQAEVSLDSELAELTLSIEPQPVARIVVDVTWVALDGDGLDMMLSFFVSAKTPECLKTVHLANTTLRLTGYMKQNE